MALRLTAFVTLAIVALAQPDATAPADAAGPTDAPATTTPKPTESPLDKYKDSAKAANEAMSSLESAAGAIRDIAGSQEKTDALGLKVLTATGGDKRDMRRREDARIDHVKSLAEAAKSAASDMGDRASDVEQASKAAGGNSSLYEPAYQSRSTKSKQMQDHAGDLSDEAADNVKKIFDTITDHIKDAQRGAKEEKKEEAQREEMRLEQKVYQKQAKANAIQAAEDAAAKANAEAAAAAAKAQADAEAAAKEQALQEAAAKEAQVAAARAKTLAEAAAKEAAAKRAAADQAAAGAGPTDAAQPALRGTQLAAPLVDTRGVVIMLGVCVGLASLAAGVSAYRRHPTQEIGTYTMLG